MGCFTPEPTTVTTVVKAEPKTADELKFLEKQTQLMEIQVQEVQRQNEALASIFPEQKILLQTQVKTATEMLVAQREQLAQTKALAAEQTPLIREQIALAREQTAAQRAQVPLLSKLGEAQIAALEASTGLQRQQLEAMQKSAATTEELSAVLKAATAETDVQRQIRETAEQRTLAYLRGEAPPLSEADKNRVQRAYDAASAEGARGIREFAEEMAAQRGMRLTDSPIGAQVLPEVRRLQENLAGAKAQAELNIGTTERQFGESIRQFQEGLRQQAFQNRMALVGKPAAYATVGQANAPLVQLPLPTSNLVTGGTGAGAGMSNISQLLSVLAQERLGQATTSQLTSGGGPSTMVGIGNFLGGLGSAATGTAAIKKGFF